MTRLRVTAAVLMAGLLCASCALPQGDSAQQIAVLAGVGRAGAIPTPGTGGALTVPDAVFYSNAQFGDPPSRSLREPTLNTGASHLTAEVGKVLGLCEVYTLLHDVREPDVNDGQSLLTYATRQNALYVAFDPRQKAFHLADGTTTTAPPDVLAAIDIQRAANYAFLLRLQYIVTARRLGQINTSVEKLRFQRAVVILDALPYASAESVLANFTDEECPSA